MFPPHEAHQRQVAQRECAHLKMQLTKLEQLVLAAFESGIKVGAGAVSRDDVRAALKVRIEKIVSEPVPRLQTFEAEAARQ